MRRETRTVERQGGRRFGHSPDTSDDAKRAGWTRADAFGSRPSRADGQAAKRAPHGPDRAAGDAKCGHYTWPRNAFSRSGG
ncbi:hypothetical protein Bmul_0410 [Burkholderia multivorans ATCC 17616]|nr:hypothetical protein Bmul_0410 [Burkholderia multivorans ATCC 17616]